MIAGPDIAALRARLSAAAAAAGRASVDALLVSPGPDLRYLTGYDAIALERLTCLVLPADGDPRVVVPRLERPAALASPVGALGLEVVAWDETDDPYALVASLLPGAGSVAVDDRMWAVKALALQGALPQARQSAAGVVLRELRMRKDAAEVEALRRAGEAIDRVHARVPEWLRPGRTEREVGRDIADAILAEGHATVDFVIVASGPNGASPHHELSDRVVQDGDVVVVDIGGAMPDGYCSDSTRTYAVGGVPAEFGWAYDALQAAQEAACAAARPGVTCAEVDAAARRVLEDAGLGDRFVHRTGHGIGLETHEEPYIVAGNDLPLEPGMAFSVEPGIYDEGVGGARIEDIVVCTDDGAERLNRRPRELVVIG
ncbi:Xaa-Pro aminopeptidase [Motilibacter rhizosphaerae]|uniref:Xaa-Pro aminopeptidase n=1 Tax=Motilibacter rhizosphaerae TaxID=598652 RepID=A0A4Q7NB89_9ACTN|nr:Xaa-Pro peptidase family protein [Motilibacter rhizosphaerae]RZS80090.1 Xaa-Pro aminopeptidase [Motilibacter rhizosphaerae]